MRVRFLLPLIKKFHRFKKTTYLSLKPLRTLNKPKKLVKFTRKFKLNSFFGFRETFECFNQFEGKATIPSLSVRIPFNNFILTTLIFILYPQPNASFNILPFTNLIFAPFTKLRHFKYLYFLCATFCTPTFLHKTRPTILTNSLVNSHFYFTRSLNFTNDLTTVATKPAGHKVVRRLRSKFKTTPVFLRFRHFLSASANKVRYIKFRWDFLNSLQPTWPSVDKAKRILFFSYIFDRRKVNMWSATKIFDLTPTWSYDELPVKSLNSYIYSDVAIYSRSFFIASSLEFDDDSYNESRMLALKPLHARRIFRNKKQLPLPLTQIKFVTPRITLFPKSTQNYLNAAHAVSTAQLVSKRVYTSYNASLLGLNSLLFNDFKAFKWTIFSLSFHQSLAQFLRANLNLVNLNVLNTCFYDRLQTRCFNNLAPYQLFSHTVEKHFLKVITKIRHKIITTPWHISHMNRFFTFCTGKRSVIRVNGFIKNSLSQTEQALCLKWSSKIQKFRKNLGNFLFLNESLQILYLSFKLKDPYFFSNWLTKMFQKISFWKSRNFLSYIRYIIRHFFFARFKELKMKGVKFQLSGKISVAGNARTRTIRYKAGYTSQSKFDNKVLTVLNLIPSFTGVQGFKIWFFF